MIQLAWLCSTVLRRLAKAVSSDPSLQCAVGVAHLVEELVSLVASSNIHLIEVSAKYRILKRRRSCGAFSLLAWARWLVVFRVLPLIQASVYFLRGPSASQLKQAEEWPIERMLHLLF